MKLNNYLFTKLIFISFFLFSGNLFSQGLTCEESEPFCTGSIYTFPAGTTGQAQPGANYGCLLTQPAPAWYHMLIEDPGDINIHMFSTPLVDIDFICWGPFEDPFEPCVSGLTGSKIVDCSYSPNPTEDCYIPNGQTGEYYILLITNYSQTVCDITFSQTSGTGSTDCTILPPPVSNNGPLCVGETLELYADTITNATYYWSGPGGFISSIQNPVIPNVTTANAGDYSCVITVGGNSSDPAITGVIINEKPTMAINSVDTTVCIGTPAYLIIELTGSGEFEVEYSNGDSTFLATGLTGPVDTIFVYPDEPTTYTITEVCDTNCCRGYIGQTVFVDTYPFTSGTISGTTSICSGEGAELTFELTGAGPWDITYTANGSNPQNSTANSSPHTVTVFPTGNTTYEISSLEDINCEGETSGSADITVNPAATVDAGTDQTIPYGTSTSLEGSAGGGSGEYSYHWEPAGKLVDPSVLSPQTVNLTATTYFTLTVTDLQGNCETDDDVTVTIEGGPLSCSPAASPEEICFGGLTQLQAMATGGSGDYTFQWSSDPPGFNSDIPNPQVSPLETTTYFVSINDGFGVVTGSVEVTVYELPVPAPGPNQSIPNGAFTTLEGGASGGSEHYVYHWEPADLLIDPDVQDPQTVNLFSTTLFTLEVTDLETGCVSEEAGQLTVNVTGDVLSASPIASPESICYGEETQLFALAGGGSGSYDYSWTGPGGFTSSLENPVLTPAETGTYTVVVDDGFNQASASVSVNVYPVPEVYLGPPDTIVCVYDTVVLDAGNEGATYLWSNGSSERIINVGTTGIGFDMKTFSVLVTDPNGCSTEESITVLFDFSQCLGISEDPHFGDIRIYPNPNSGSFTVEISGYTGNISLSVSNMYGQVLLRKEFRGVRIDLNEDFSLEGIPAGIYLITLKDDIALTSRKLLIRE